ncbi:phosphatidate cytidylyltransferase [Flavobacterium sp. CYK-55]|uniref:phosphatidate cytidylyltransferase n=1 Tax=Flavobacterium sp. CYK-55 TaxID=2835529 RepID=UPI001BCD6551|nr:phosphatidate cytidylyltransferase [Flavobacterium sp. CYK-55]MBS7787761.1 phosphatidate cytidylyltransferase [Flavobacterium sp. CYK-55]
MNETLTRALSGVLYVVVLISATLFHQSFLILFGLLLLLAVHEYTNLTQLPKTIPFILSILSYSLLAFNELPVALNWFLLTFTLLTSLKAILFLFEQSNEPLSKLDIQIFFWGYILVPFILLTKIPQRPEGFIPSVMIGIYILVWVNDTMAYVVGKSIGKNKLYERISPKKTIEGFIGGVVFAIVAGIIMATFYFDQSAMIWSIIAFMVGVIGTIGDLIESKFKRIAGVKDSGNIMPGHGGILDRLDSIIFVGPFVFLLYQIINYVS